jgi:hypothetical protein
MAVFNPAAIIAFNRAALVDEPKQATSPVEAISTPSFGEAPFSRSKLN